MSNYNFEQLMITNELGEVIRLHNQAVERLKLFRETYPHLIAPNLARMAEENLKENVTVLYRELNNLHKPKSEQRRHVCRECHNVFVVPLPGGICDECKAKLSAPGGSYGGRPHLPEAESDTLSDAFVDGRDDLDLTPVPSDEHDADDFQAELTPAAVPQSSAELEAKEVDSAQQASGTQEAGGADSDQISGPEETSSREA